MTHTLPHSASVPHTRPHCATLGADVGRGSHVTSLGGVTVTYQCDCYARVLRTRVRRGGVITRAGALAGWHATCYSTSLAGSLDGTRPDGSSVRVSGILEPPLSSTAGRPTAMVSVWTMQPPSQRARGSLSSCNHGTGRPSAALVRVSSRYPGVVARP